MNAVIHRFNLDLHSSQSQISIPVMQGDTNRAFHITLSEGGKPYNIEDGIIAVLTVKHPTGTHLVRECVILRNNTIEYDFRRDDDDHGYTAAVLGNNNCELTLYAPDASHVASPKFGLVVHDRAMPRTTDLPNADKIGLDGIYAAEQRRAEAENQRETNEVDRGHAEMIRTIAEQGRVKAENERIEAGNVALKAVADAKAEVENARGYAESAQSYENSARNHAESAQESALVAEEGAAQAHLDKTRMDVNAHENYYTSMQQMVSAYGDNGKIKIVPKGTKAVYSGDGLSNYKVVVLPNGLETIGAAFANTNALETIILPPTLQTLEYAAFYKNSGLKSISLPDSVVSIGDSAFQDCTALTEFVFGNGVKQLGKNMFFGCSSLKTAKLPNSLTEIPDNAFVRWNGLTDIDIPNSIVRIGTSAFQNCPSLRDVSLLSFGQDKEFPELGTSAFAHVNNEEFANWAARIIVPKGRKEQLASKENWSTWEKIMIER